jgi:ATP-dependent Clp protease ATP-binding subunit ClpA
MTSNIGQQEFSDKAKQIGFDTSVTEEEKIMKDFSKAKEKIIANLDDYFSPEFINRIDKVIVFSPLDTHHIKNIIKLQLDDLSRRLAEKKFSIVYEVKLLNFIAKKVYNPDFGAREIRRYITDQIEDKIAQYIIEGTKKNSFTIKVIKDEIIVS